MYRQVSELMQWRADLLSAERFEDLAREYVLPYVLYRDDCQIVAQHHEEVVALFAQLRAHHRSCGIVRLQAKVAAIDLPRNGRLRVWLRYCRLDARDSVVSQSDVIHYCCQTPSGLKTEMAEYETSVVPVISQRNGVILARSH